MLPLSTLFESPTIAKLVQRMKMRETHGEWRSLVPINPNGSNRPLFLIHGAEGNVLMYRPLATHLGKDQPVYGLQAAGLDGRELMDVNLIKVASSYIEEIKTVQPYGPYLLGGYCLGGTIALEMAHQLQAMGESGSLVVMFENYNIKAMQWPLPTYMKVGNSFLNSYYHFLNLISARGGWFAFFKEKLKVEISRARISAWSLWVKTHRLMGRKDEYLHHLKIGEAYDNALVHYEVKPYSGRVALFLSTKCFFGFPSTNGGWGDIIKGGLEVYKLSTYPRSSMIEPHVRELSLKLRALLDETPTQPAT
jgi:phthiocerol/phenolphthiocerol synthesis type-I polyketide synthase E